MLRSEVIALLISWGWISLGGYIVSSGPYTIDLEHYGLKRGFMVTHDTLKHKSHWVSENDIHGNFIVNYFLCTFPRMEKVRSERKDELELAAFETMQHLE